MGKTKLVTNQLKPAILMEEAIMEAKRYVRAMSNDVHMGPYDRPFNRPENLARAFLAVRRAVIDAHDELSFRGPTDNASVQAARQILFDAFTGECPDGDDK